MQALRVLHVLDHSLPVVSGYSVRSHAVLCAQRALGLAPVAVTSPKHPSADGDGIVDGIEYVRTGGMRVATAPLVGEGQGVHRLARRLRREVAQRRVDLLHAHSPVLDGLAALRAAARAGVPLVYEVRALWEDAAVHRGTQTAGSPRYRATRAVETFLMRRADAVVAISHALCAEARRRGVRPSRVFHVPNGVDATAFRPTAPDAALVRQYDLDGKVVFGYVGSLLNYEGLDILLRAFALHHRAVPQTRVLLVGDGDEAAALRAAARSLGIDPHVIFAGPAAPAEVRRWYSVCDALVYPRLASRLTEMTTPLKPLEAMAMGKLVVGSDVGGLRELIGHGARGVLCAPGAPEALATVLAEIGREPGRWAAIGETARRWVCAERDWPQVVQRYECVYATARDDRRRIVGGGV